MGGIPAHGMGQLLLAIAGHNDTLMKSIPLQTAVITTCALIVGLLALLSHHRAGKKIEDRDIYDVVKLLDACLANELANGRDAKGETIRINNRELDELMVFTENKLECKFAVKKNAGSWQLIVFHNNDTVRVEPLLRAR